MMMKKNKKFLYTIGFTGTTAENFFKRLKENNISKLIDIRLNNKSQLSGFAKKDDIKFFLKEILKIKYKHVPKFAPSDEILKNYRNKEMDWTTYEKLYSKLIIDRNVEKILSLRELNRSCLLCSESKETYCHRRILAEYLKGKFPDLSIIHL